MTGHSWYSPKRMAWLTYCYKCGHVALKNDISQLISRIGCDYEEHPAYLHWKRSIKSRKPI